MEIVTVELRPRLRSLSAYLLFTKNVETSVINIKLLENAVELKIGENMYILPLPNIKLMPSSLSSLNVSQCWISFRMQMEPNSKYGTFNSEILDNGNFSHAGLINGHVTPIKVNLPPKDTDCIVICACCKNNISRTVNFRRILELPSSDYDPQ